MDDPARARPLRAWRGGTFAAETRTVPGETAIAIDVQGTTQAVMMATPADLTDFAYGFARAEGIVSAPGDVTRLDIRPSALGVTIGLWLAPGLAEAHEARRRALVGPTGCGLCGVESLEAAAPALPRLESALTATSADIIDAMAALRPAQALNARTHAVHAAGFVALDRAAQDRSLLLREDVGRHNALDKLCGALLRAGADGGEGLVVLSSRVSVEMVQKTVRMGAPILVAVSAPTDLACRTAEAAGLTLVAVARGEEFEVFTHTERIQAG
ncbi:MAG: formate dehydrogenase accessory sulfurtransferase FdhD [Pseudomonadota bacterium]